MCSSAGKALPPDVGPLHFWIVGAQRDTEVLSAETDLPPYDGLTNTIHLTLKNEQNRFFFRLCLQCHLARDALPGLPPVTMARLSAGNEQVSSLTYRSVSQLGIRASYLEIKTAWLECIRSQREQRIVSSLTSQCTSTMPVQSSKTFPSANSVQDILCHHWTTRFSMLGMATTIKRHMALKPILSRTTLNVPIHRVAKETCKYR